MAICVAGGGPAGMMAAIMAAENGNKVTLVEKNEKLGKKLFLTGKGRCNLSNACPVEELFDNIATNRKFLYSAIYDFDNTAVAAFFNEHGLKTKVERGGRVFPISDHSSDVISVLRRTMDKLGVNVLLNTEVVRIMTEEDKISGVIVRHDGKESLIKTGSLILATGGCSYPLTGSDGKSFGLIEKFGIKTVSPEPSLVPIECDDPLITGMQGLSLKNVGVTVKAGRKTVYSGFGEMLFTHFGLSGPLILSASAFLHEMDYRDGVVVSIDLKNALTHEELDRRVLRDFEENRNRNLSNALDKLLPSKIITAVIHKAGLDPAKKINAITKSERTKLVDTLKNFEIKSYSSRGFDEAIITRGGVSVSAINPSTMESKDIKGLYFAGEMIDTDALTGGFNLQIAWSTGALAGRSAASAVNAG